MIGKTNDNGTEVTDREVDQGHLFHTYLTAVGVDSTGHFDIAGRDVPMADPAYQTDQGADRLDANTRPVPTPTLDVKQAHIVTQLAITTAR